MPTELETLEKLGLGPGNKAASNLRCHVIQGNTVTVSNTTKSQTGHVLVEGGREGGGYFCFPASFYINFTPLKFAYVNNIKIIFWLQDFLTRVEEAVDRFLYWDEEITIQVSKRLLM